MEYGVEGLKQVSRNWGWTADPGAFRTWRKRDCLPECEHHSNGRTSDPFPRLVEFHVSLFQGTGLRFEIVNPAHQRGKTHQNRFGSSASFETKYGAPVVKQIELHVPSPAIELVLTFTFRIRFSDSAACQRKIGRQERVPKFGNECEIPFHVAFNIIEEQTAHSPRFPAMLEKEILVAPLLEAGIMVGIMPVADVFQRPMKMNRVFGIRIVGRQIRAAAKPRRITLFQIAEIRVNRGNHRAPRVQHQRNAGREKRGAVSPGNPGCEFFGKASGNRREIYAGLFKDPAFLHNACAASSAAFSGPDVFSKLRSVQFFKAAADSILKSSEELLSSFTPQHDRMITGMWHNPEMQSEQLEYEEMLKAWVEIPSISAEPERRADIARLAEAAAATIRKFGGTAETIATPGNPVVVGRFGSDPSLPTVTIYNHLDVQPANEPQWTREPFAFHQENGHYFGRGTTDDKGPAIAALFGTRLAMQRKTPINVQLIWETEEEIGSPNFEHFLKANAAKLQTDSVVVSDSIWTRRGRPAIGYGLRGLAPFRMVLETGTKDVHSGTTGGAARNPIGELCKIISECYDARTGNVKIPGFYKDVLKPSRAEMANFLASGFTTSEFRRAHELKKIRSTSAAEAVRSIWAHPTFEVHGMVGGYTGPGVKTAIAPKAEAKVSMRLVPNQDPTRIFRLVKAFIKKRNPDIQVFPESFLEPFLGPKSGPFAEAAQEAMRSAFGKEPAWVREGGSIGAVVTMQKYLKAPIVFLGLSLPEHGYHAPNENFDWEQASGGIQMFARYFELLSKVK